MGYRQKLTGPQSKTLHASALQRVNMGYCGRLNCQASASARAMALGLTPKSLCSHVPLLQFFRQPQKAFMNTRSGQHKHGIPGTGETAEDVPDLVELPVNPDEARPLLPDEDGAVQVPT